MLNSIFAQVFLPISIFIIMAGIGMTLVWDDFRRVLVYPKAVFIGVFCQLLLLPLIGFAIATSFSLSPEYAVGIMLLAACPGGTTSNLISHLARADTALSITLTSITSIITVISIPVIVSASISHFMAENQSIQLPIVQSIGALLGLTVLPVALGMLLRAKRPAFAKAQQSRVNLFAMLLMGVLVVGIVYQERVVLINEVGTAGLPAILLNVSSMLLGFALARIAGLNADQTTSITVEVGIQNATIAILVAVTLLGNASLALPAALYSLSMYVTGGIVIALRRHAKAIDSSTGVQ